MGTRADFYVGRGPEAEWLGSIAWDGHDIPPRILDATTEDDYRAATACFLGGREDATLPAQGWPWPWADSRTTDRAYLFADGRVLRSCFGSAFVEADAPDDDDDVGSATAAEDWPQFDTDPVTFGERSGLLVLGLGRR